MKRMTFFRDGEKVAYKDREEILREWEEYIEELRGKGIWKERKEGFSTISRIPVREIYFPDWRDGEEYMKEIGFPGSFPFVRGIYPTMYRGRVWTFRQYAGFGSAEETNRRFHYLLDRGQTGLSVAFDLPTQMGLDPDSPLSEGEVGKVGVSIGTIDDIKTLFKGISLKDVSTSMTINATAAHILSMYLVLGEEMRESSEEFRGTLQNDILKEYVARGTYIFPPAPSIRLTTDIISFCLKKVPHFNPISISGYHIREAGADAVQEVAFTLSNGIEYVKSCIDSGLDVDEFGPRLSFFFGVHNNFIEEIAKFRAARRLWARIMKDRFGAKNPRSMMLRFHTQTCGCTLTAQMPENNIVRVAYQALAAVLGGTQSLHTNSMDEALSIPSESAVKIALRTQQILALETGVTDFIDPFGGSGAVEELTDKIEAMAVEYIRKIDEMGGASKAIESGFIAREILNSAYHYQQEIEKGNLKVVGVNCLKEESPPNLPILVVDRMIEETQKKRIQEIRSSRSNADVQRALDKISRDAESDNNLIPSLISAVRVKATIGEITESLVKVFGRYRPDSTL